MYDRPNIGIAEQCDERQSPSLSNLLTNQPRRRRYRRRSVPQLSTSMINRRVCSFAALLGIVVLIIIGLFARALSVNTSRYYSQIGKDNSETNRLIGSWVRSGTTTQMILRPNSTGRFLANDGTEVHFDWTCDGSEFQIEEYNTPLVSLVKIRRIATMDTSMSDRCSIVKVNGNELHLVHSSDPSTLIRYDRVD
jgi:hypothetical protein